MRSCLLIIISIFSLLETLFAQNAPPNGMLYQAVARDASGNLAVRRTIYVRTSILKTTPTGTVMYSDEHKVTSNADAMFTVVIGQGNFVTGSYRKITDIPWGDDKYFFNLKISVAPSLPGSSWRPTYVDMGTSQFWSVPYALFAGVSETTRDTGVGQDLQTLTQVGNVVTLSKGGGSVTLIDTDQQQLSISAGKGTVRLSNGGAIQLADSSSTNEIQVLSKSGNTLSLSKGGGSVNLNVSATGRYIGERFGGGVVFHLWKDSLGSEHGLIVSLKDLSNNASWSNIATAAVGTNSQSLWDGLNNSLSIIKQSGHTNSAAKLCLDLNTGGFDDWYLPALDELIILNNNRIDVNRTLSAITGSNVIALDFYYSSTEQDYQFSYGFDFLSLNTNNRYKLDQVKVRAVRSF
ncbi:MAG: hypothetical protein ACK5XN_11385 [Bacteroidota bacterium]|jgi:hypothetical protein